MALDYSILSFKPTITKNGQEMQDLLVKTFNDDANIGDVYDVIEVTDEYVARPDLVSFALYGNDEYGDILCKINGISNPFELNKGMVLICPTLQLIKTFAATKTSPKLERLADDADELITNKQSHKKNKNTKRSPNEATIDDHNYVLGLNDRVVIYNP